MTHNSSSSQPMCIGLQNKLAENLENLSGPMEIQGQEAGIWLSVSKLQQLVSSLPKTQKMECDFQRISPATFPETRLADMLAETNLSSSAPSTNCVSIPPIGVFWDIENCQVPNGVSALSVVQFVRETFFQGYREEEFVVVCDVTKENSQVIQELNAAQIDLVHVASICKNAADEKLRQSMRRFAERHGRPAAVVLLSGDINFASDLSDIKFRKQIRVILLHPTNTSDALIMCSDEHYNFVDLAKSLPHRSIKGTVSVPDPFDLMIRNLPDSKVHGTNRTRQRLRQLSYNCGGKVINVSRFDALLRFASHEAAARARVRMDGEDVLGQRIQVSKPQIARSASAGAENKACLTEGVKMSLQNFPVGFLPHVPPPMRQFTSAATGAFSQATSQQAPSLATASEMFNYALVPPPAMAMPPPQPSFSQVLASGQSNKKRTISPSMGSKNGKGRVSPFPVRADADGSESKASGSATADRSESPVELQIANLDFNMDTKEVRKTLLEAFKEHVTVLNVSVFTQSDGQLGARVKVPSKNDAQVAIAALHRKRIGNRRVRITMSNQTRGVSVSPSSQLVRDNVKTLLMDVPGLTLPLFKLCELYERRFLSSVSLSELNRMRDLVSITGSSNAGRTISLLPDARRSITPSFLEMAESALKNGHPSELPYCPRHCKQTGQTGWADISLEPLPNIRVRLLEFSSQIYQLLQSHNGSMSLFSLPLCYEAEIGKLETYSHGVPLEHLVTWVHGVVLKSSPNGGCSKMLCWGESTPAHQCPVQSFDEPCTTEVALDRATSPAQLAAQLALFGREVVELLRGATHCQIQFTKFIPSYHHHFGRQCRVASYGFTRLIDLLEAIPTVIQVIGEGENRVVVLAQQAQVRRFTSDLIRILKAQTKRQAILSELPDMFTKTFSKDFDPINYGLCSFLDLVHSVPPNTIVFEPPIQEGQLPSQNTILSLPKREQTAEEAERTRHFAKEVVSLLRNAPRCAIPFNKFIPAYHHHFGRQCRLSDFGVTKLTELLIAVSDVVEIKDLPNGERHIILSLLERQSVLADQLRHLLLRHGGRMLLDQINASYQHEHGVALDPEKYGATNLFDLVNNISSWLQVVSSSKGPCVQIVKQVQNLKVRVLFILMEENPRATMKIDDLRLGYEKMYESTLSISDLTNLDKMLSLDRDKVTLTPIYKCAAQIFAVIYEQKEPVPLNNLFNLFVVKWGKPLNTAQYGHSSVTALLNSIPEVFSVTGKANKRMVSIQQFLEDAKPSLKSSSKSQTQVMPAFNNNTLSHQTPGAAGGSDSDFGSITWGSLLPTPNASQQSQGLPFAPQSCMPWIGKPLGLQPTNYFKDMGVQNGGIWPAAAINPMSSWSPPKAYPHRQSPDLSSLPLPTLDLTAKVSEAPLDLSDSGIGHSSPLSSRRRSRLAANFSNPIDLH
ncbi:meiosis regulator and mRNA stability factor 1 isoform X2 [Neocloeon triangulifer]|uniref:meiosis regulator and mRNA stability factor 1 isoform X2 n=1 Tax=Neocloeon triangulifer TaxID=2078957 RepID=UPI00286F30F1|nr:meiosis regulator and mRNA stability factor 1 isoform X2 [Neocloeon triangulifer]